MTDAEEAAVVSGLRAGDPAAWRSLYDAYSARVWRTAARLMGPDAADVADVVQETFLAAARSARQFDPDRGSLWVWLLTICRNQVAQSCRRQHRRDRLHRAARQLATANGQLRRWLDGEPDSVGTAVETRELAALVRAVLAELSWEHEALLTARYLDDVGVDELAATANSTPGAVRSQLVRARRAFREKFERLVAAEDTE
jgi:RNA polymerase sigma-70 factor (ECF subfamily)